MHAIGREREHLRPRQSSATADRDKTNMSLSGEGELCAEGGRQACPDQTKAVRGQNDKRMLAAGPIKGASPCPVKGTEKQRKKNT